MEKHVNDARALSHIERLVSEEHRLYEQQSLSETDHQRLQKVKVELDQCWDLLRQRRALREFGEDSGRAKVRPPGTVEGYEQ